MTASQHWIHKRWGRLPAGLWIWLAVVVLVCVLFFCWFCVRRQLVEFRPQHRFGIHDPAFFGSAHALADPVPLAGNRITLLNNGDEIFPAMLGAIHAAKRSVNFEAYLLWTGTVGSEFRDALCERAQAGVPVRVLLDGIGSGLSLDNSYVDAMRKAGCHFSYFHPTHSWRIDRMNRRSHRRVLVVDGTLGFTGGVGFADEWQGHAEAPEHWRDVQVRVEGPLVAKLQGAFQQHWTRSTGEVMQGPEYFPALAPVGNLRAQMIASQSFSIAALPLAQATAVAAAERRIWITNPYWTPGKDQVELLVEAVKRGVDVQVLVPGKDDNHATTKAAGRTAYGQLLEAGVKVFEYQPTMIHSKLMVVDGMFSIVGSSNLDTRSAQINEELDLTVYDETFGAELEKTFMKDLEQARPYTLEEFKKRGPWERFHEWLIAPFRSQL
ncbi:MAG: cardiolipin synthase [Chthoniobacter sp.]|nr:cardiolipin synthase [Chthoniobacter sp.]